jgi:ATPase subunit of ABC transporter with duplicated ATPase domains
MVKISQLTKKYGSQTLFENINLSLDRGKKYGLIGANGAGKSTFLKILCNIEDSTTGDVHIEKGKRVGVLNQNQFEFEEFTLYDAVLYGNKRLYDAQKEKEKLYEAGDFESDEVNNRLSELEMVCVEEDPTYESDVYITKLLSDLGFSKDEHQNLMSSIASSQKVKILLAQVLFPKPDILFLDEPTNNLDLEAISWLENQLLYHEGVVLVISHDRHFLNAICNVILDIDFKTIREFTGTYDNWYLSSTLIAKQHETDRNKKLAEKEKLEDFVRRFSANASKAKQATSRQKLLDKIDVESVKVSTRRDPSIVFKQQREVGKSLLDIEKMSQLYDDLTVFDNFDLHIEKGDKIALIGGNGVGKSTLCKLIMEEVQPNKGSVELGSTVQVSYFPQDTTDIINGEETLYEWLQAFDKKADLSVIRSCLGRMLFSGEEQQKSIKNISGGEKHRMMLSKMMLEEGNFLILDEPDNHLDLESIVALSEALYEYEGSVICVSHDRDMIGAFANRILCLYADGSYKDFRGSYEEFINEENKK